MGEDDIYEAAVDLLRSIACENPTTGAVLAQTSSQRGATGQVSGTSTAIHQPVMSTDSMPANPYEH